MHQTSELYRTLLRDPRHRKEMKVSIAGIDYGEDALLSLETSGGVFKEPDIGCCASRQIDLSLRKFGGIPRSAKIQVFVRLAAGERVSEWIPKGVFFISTRRKDRRSGFLELHGFDAMRRAGDVWDIDPYANWPMSQQEAAADIARQMGVELDPRTVLSSDFPVAYPVDENGDMAMQDVLEGIAVCSAGNWVITDEGKLLLLRLGDIPPETSYLVTEHGRAITLGGLRILVG
jgi:hypothetical protein